jgi:hypothetical protein
MHEQDEASGDAMVELLKKADLSQAEALKKWFTEYRGEALFRLRTIEATLWCKLDQLECRTRRRARQLRLCRH